jgi:hypothetical protein
MLHYSSRRGAPPRYRDVERQLTAPSLRGQLRRSPIRKPFDVGVDATHIRANNHSLPRGADEP